MEDFPTNLELTAASALLLLSTIAESTTTTTTTTTTTSLCKLSSSSEEEEIVVVNERKQCDEDDEVEIIDRSDVTRSSLTYDYSVPSHHRMKLMVSAVARYRHMQLKVARRARSKVIYRSSYDIKPAIKNWENVPAKTPQHQKMSTLVTEGTTTTESSCLSSGGTSEISSARKRGKAVMAEQKRRRGTSASHISRKKDAILRLLSCFGRASEVRIRLILGDSPDTSKALRMLLRMEEVKRSGVGGRGDPFMYMIAADSASKVS